MLLSLLSWSLLAALSHAQVLDVTQSGGEILVNATSSPEEVTWTLNGEALDETGSVLELSLDAVGEYTIGATIMDVTEEVTVSVTSYTVPSPPEGSIRIASYNVAFSDSLNPFFFDGGLTGAMMFGNISSVAQVAEVLQHIDADIVLLNEYDHVWVDNVFDETATLETVENFQTNYLEVPQADGLEGIRYEHVFVAPCNTGVRPDGAYDFNNNNNTAGDPNDAFGFGFFAGQYSMVVLSKYPVEGSRTFAEFLWKDMPDAYLPLMDGDVDTTYYNESELEVYRLSSKSHWDVSVNVDGEIIHLLASHPTPPVFDDGTATEYPADIVDWNGFRNHDEIRFWQDYVNGEEYFYDDADTMTGGLDSCARFVVMGDLNADPIDGDSTLNPMGSFLADASIVDASVVPESPGALEYIPEEYSERASKTSRFNLRVDYALPSAAGFDYNQAFVFWPALTDLEYTAGDVSDHRAVVSDLTIVPLECDEEPVEGDTDNEPVAPAEPPVDPPVDPPAEETSSASVSRFMGVVVCLL